MLQRGVWGGGADGLAFRGARKLVRPARQPRPPRDRFSLFWCSSGERSGSSQESRGVEGPYGTDRPCWLVAERPMTAGNRRGVMVMRCLGSGRLLGLSCGIGRHPGGEAWPTGPDAAVRRFPLHTVLTDGNYTSTRLPGRVWKTLRSRWMANSEHGGQITARSPGQPPTGPVCVAEPASYSFRRSRKLRREYPHKLIVHGLEWNVPAHELAGRHRCNAPLPSAPSSTSSMPR